MYVCICKAVTDRQIRGAIRQGADTLSELQARLPVATGCGCCRGSVLRLLAEERESATVADDAGLAAFA
ncbi:MAG TPA: (2Fe-2S)-binding protein [Steroidobacteraceae bacterium]|nr:(2Fe-2S)-binding protein [Steroidobacteraceae bacterium]